MGRLESAEEVAERYFNETSPFVEMLGYGDWDQQPQQLAGMDCVRGKPMPESPFLVGDAEGVTAGEMLDGCGGEEEQEQVAWGTRREAFQELQKMWEDKWHGKRAWSSSSPSDHSTRSLMGKIRKTLTSIIDVNHIGRRDSTPVCAWMEESPTKGLFSVRSWQRLFISKPSGPKLTKSGPCELFADWPIPPYPSDYEWDD